MAAVTLEKLVKRYGDLEVVHGLDLAIKDKEFVVFVGPSGCGKSTTLRMIAGLEDISGGALKFGDTLVNDLPPRERNISMVFQDYALYPHMSVRKNLGFSLSIQGVAKEEIARQVADASNILGLDELLDRKPAQLSGGQRQRVAMGRAIVRHPDVYLFDEPLSNLDAKLRSQMRVEIKKLHQKVGTTIIYVTHDQVEAMTLADRIVIMRDGHIEQIGTPLEVFEHPVNTFVATFIGSPPMNLIDATVHIADSTPQLVLNDGTHLAVAEQFRQKLKDGQALTLGFRADNIAPKGHCLPIEGETIELSLTVNISEPLGTETMLFCALAGSEVQAKMYNPRIIENGEKLDFQLALDKCYLFDKQTGESLEYFNLAQ